MDKTSKARLAGDLDVELRVGDTVELASQGKAIAVLPFVDLNGDVRAGGKKLGEDLTTGLVQGGLSVVERTLLAKVLIELGLQNTKAFDADKAQKIGKQVGAYAILIGTLSASGYRSDGNFRLVKVETGEILFATRQSGPALGGIVSPGLDVIIVPGNATGPSAVAPAPSPSSGLDPLASTGGIAAAQGWQSLFNGRDLTGWDGDPNAWSVQDGAITGDNIKNRRTTFLIWQGGGPGDFELRLRARLFRGNSGIQFRSRVLNDWVVNGYQMEVVDAALEYFGALSYEGRGHVSSTVLIPCNERATWTQALGKEVTGFTGTSIQTLRRAFRDGGWNDYVITAQSNRMILRINGLITVDFTDNHPAYRASSGVIALQLNGWRDLNTKAQFKDIFLRPLAAR
jgi:TolB-like protein